jgi:HD superfamily phosphohydrolases
MYWQVYLHKTVLAAEFLLINILKRAKYLAINGESIFSTPLLSIFLTKKITFDFLISGQVNGNSLFSIFAELDDNDILASIKQWQYEKDKVLSYLSICLIARKLFSIEVQDKPFDESRIEVIKLAIMEKFGLDETEVCYLFINESIMNSIYGGDEKINILDKDGKVKEFSEASDINLSNLSIPVRKYIICYPKELDIN